MTETGHGPINKSELINGNYALMTAKLIVTQTLSIE